MMTTQYSIPKFGTIQKKFQIVGNLLTEATRIFKDDPKKSKSLVYAAGKVMGRMKEHILKNNPDLWDTYMKLNGHVEKLCGTFYKLEEYEKVTEYAKKLYKAMKEDDETKGRVYLKLLEREEEKISQKEPKHPELLEYVRYIITAAYGEREKTLKQDIEDAKKCLSSYGEKILGKLKESIKGYKPLLSFI